MPSTDSNKQVITIVIDTRERQPYAFDPTSVRICRRALRAGDYSIDGLESAVAIERKSLDDFVNTVIHRRRRFYRELARLAECKAAAIVVEADLRDIVTGEYRSDAHPNAVFGSVVAIAIDFGIPVWFCSDRQTACRFVEAFLLRYQKKEMRCVQNQGTAKS